MCVGGGVYEDKGYHRMALFVEGSVRLIVCSWFGVG